VGEKTDQLDGCNHANRLKTGLCQPRSTGNAGSNLIFVFGSRTAYRRGDALEKRRKLMEAWAAYCEPKRSANVVQMRKGNAL
jgi:hypothetical protein